MFAARLGDARHFIAAEGPAAGLMALTVPQPAAGTRSPGLLLKLDPAATKEQLEAAAAGVSERLMNCFDHASQGVHVSAGNVDCSMFLSVGRVLHKCQGYQMIAQPVDFGYSVSVHLHQSLWPADCTACMSAGSCC